MCLSDARRVVFLPGRKVFLPCHGEKLRRKGKIPFCQGEMAETGEKFLDVFILRCKA